MKNLFVCLLFLSSLSAGNFLKSDNVVIDLEKNVMWQDDIEATQYTETWGMAKEYCKSLTLSGYTDWKLPTIKELQTIVNIKKKDLAIYAQFKYAQPSSYWSNTQDIINKSDSWYVGFKTGATFKDSKDYECYVRCIRTRFKER